ncbi:MAG: accessory factor UbiK family protein [Rhodospirillales bacterium]
MQTTNRFFEDLAKVASGAASTLVGVKQEVDALVRQRIERFAADLDLVTREEFEAVKAVATAARTEQERLERRLGDLEARLAAAGDGAVESGGE